MGVGLYFIEWRKKHEPGYRGEIVKMLSGRFTVDVFVSKYDGATRRELPTCLDYSFFSTQEEMEMAYDAWINPEVDNSDTDD